MVKQPSGFIISLICMVLLAVSVASFKIKDQGNCSNPLIMDFLHNYQIPVDDLKSFVEDNISSINLGPFTASGVSFSDVQMEAIYTDNQQTNRSTPFKVVVKNDSFMINLTWTANVSYLTVYHRIYQVTANLSKLIAGYTKLFDKDSIAFQIVDTTFNMNSDQFLFHYDPDNITDTHKARIQNLTKSQVFQKIKSLIGDLENKLNDHAKNQRVTRTYHQNQYIYTLNDLRVNINTKTLLLDGESPTDFLSGYVGQIIGQDNGSCPANPTHYKPSYSMYLTKQFIQNFGQYVIQSYAPYQRVILDKKIPTQTFQFRLVDLEYVIDGLSDADWQNYLSDVNFNCSAISLTHGPILQDYIFQFVNWNCRGVLLINPTPKLIMNLTAKVSYKIQISVENSKLKVFSKAPQIISVSYQPIDGITVKNEQVANIFMAQIAHGLQLTLPGTNFTVTGSQVQLNSDEKSAGIWLKQPRLPN